MILRALLLVFAGLAIFTLDLRAATYAHHGHYGFLMVTRTEVGEAVDFVADMTLTGATNTPVTAISGVFAMPTDDGWQVYVGGWPTALRGVYDLTLRARAADNSVRTVTLSGVVTVAAERMDVALLLDDSFSMRRTDPARLRVAAAQLFARVAAARGSIRTLTIVAFGRTSRLLLPPTDPSDSVAINHALNGLVAEGSTDMDAAFMQVARVFATLPDSRKIAVVLSDGHDQPGRYEDAHLRFSAAHWPVYTVGLSEFADTNTLCRISNQTGGEYRFAPDTRCIEAIFQEIVLSLHHAVMLGEWSLDRVNTQIPVDDSVRLLTLELDAAINTRCHINMPQRQMRELATDAASNAVCEVYAPPRGFWQVSAATGGVLRATVESDLELVMFPITTVITDAVPVYVSALLLRDFEPVTSATVRVELATGGTVILASTKSGRYGGWLVPAVAGSSICCATAYGQTPAGWPFQRIATQIWQVSPVLRDSLWVQPLPVALEMYPGTVVTGVVQIAGRGMFSSALIAPVTAAGVVVELLDSCGRLPDGTACSLRVGVRASLDAVPGTYMTYVAVTVGALPPLRVPVMITVLTPAIVIAPDVIKVPLMESFTSAPLPAVVETVVVVTNTPMDGQPRTNVAAVPPPMLEPVAAQAGIIVNAETSRFNWAHLLLIALLSLLMALLLVKLLRRTSVHRLTKYFVLSALLHLAFLLLGLDLLIQTRVVQMEQIAPSLAVRIEALEQKLGFEITPLVAPISMTDNESAAVVARASSVVTVDELRRAESRPTDAAVAVAQAQLALKMRSSELAADVADAVKQTAKLAVDASIDAMQAPKPVVTPTMAAVAPLSVSVERTMVSAVTRDETSPDRTVPTQALANAPASTAVAVEIGAIVASREQPMATISKTDKRVDMPLESLSLEGAVAAVAVHRVTPKADVGEQGPVDSAVPTAAGRERLNAAAAGTRHTGVTAEAGGTVAAPTATETATGLTPIRVQRLAAVGDGTVSDKRKETPLESLPLEGAAAAVAVHRVMPKAGAGSNALGVASIDQTASVAVIRGQRRANTVPERSVSDTAAVGAVTVPEETHALVKIDVPLQGGLPGVRGSAVAGDLALRFGDGSERGSVSTTLGMARYGGDWDCAKTAMMFLGHQLRERTGMGLMAGDRIVTLDDPELRKLPFVYLTGHRDFQFTESEVRNLRTYLQNGGHLWADDSTHYRDETFDRAFRRELARVLPGTPLMRLGADFKGFQTGYDLSQGYKGYVIPPGDKYRLDYIEGVSLGDRVAVVYTRNDYGHGLDIDPHTQPLEPSLTSLSPAEMQEGATRMGVNLVLYFLSQGGKVDGAFMSRTAHTMRTAHERVESEWPTGIVRPWPAFNDATGWFSETWGDPATWTVVDGVLHVRFEVADKEKAAIGRMYAPPMVLEAHDVLAVELVSRLSCGARVALGLSVGPDYFETAPYYVKPGANRIFFRCDAHTFKTQASKWEYRDALRLPVSVDKVNLMIYAPAAGEFELRNARLICVP